MTVDPAELAAIIRAVEDGAISRGNAKEVLEAHVATGEAAAAIIAERGFVRISDAGALTAAVDEVLAANPAAVADYRAGKQQAVGFLVGQVMKATRGQADAALAQAHDPRAARDRGVGSQATMGPLNLLLWAAGIVLVVVGYTRARGPWQRYQALKEQDANVARYEAWRGGLRDDGKTGASVAMAGPAPPGPAAGLDRRSSASCSSSWAS